nr:hypothetical protein [Erwinia sp. Ejp617]
MKALKKEECILIYGASNSLLYQRNYGDQYVINCNNGIIGGMIAGAMGGIPGLTLGLIGGAIAGGCFNR